MQLGLFKQNVLWLTVDVPRYDDTVQQTFDRIKPLLDPSIDQVCLMRGDAIVRTWNRNGGLYIAEE